MSDTTEDILGIDPRFVSVRSDIDSFLDIIFALQKQIPELIDNKKELAADQIRKFEQKAKPSILNNQLVKSWEYTAERFERLLIPRIYCAMLTSLYAICESAIITIANILREEKRQGLTLDDLRGSFSDRAKIYFKHILGFTLFDTNMAWERFKMLTALRHAFAHANGRLDLIGENRKNNIQKWQQAQLGISVYDNYVVINDSFLLETHTIMRDAIQNIINRVGKAYPYHPKETD